MGRAIGGVVVGYLVMFVLVFVSFSLAYLAMGPDGAFKPQSYDASGLWLATSFILGFVAAVVGGYVCVVIARRSKAPLVLAALMIVLGLLMAVPTLSPPTDAPKERTSDVPTMEAMMNAVQPPWVAFLNPFVGAVGVVLGARMKRSGAEGACAA